MPSTAQCDNVTMFVPYLANWSWLNFRLCNWN